MKYIAIFDDKDLSNFRVDEKSAECGCKFSHENRKFSYKVLVVGDKMGFSRGIALKPLQEPMIVSEEGNSAYLSQEHIDCLIEMEKKQMFDKVVKDIINSFKRQNHRKNRTVD